MKLAAGVFGSFYPPLYASLKELSKISCTQLILATADFNI